MVQVGASAFTVKGIGDWRCLGDAQQEAYAATEDVDVAEVFEVACRQ